MGASATLLPLALLPLAFFLGSMSGNSAGLPLITRNQREGGPAQLTVRANLTVEDAAACSGGGAMPTAALPGQQQEHSVVVKHVFVPTPIPAARRTLSDAWKLQIQRDLAPFRAAGGVTRSMVATAAKLKDWRQIRVLIYDNQLYVRPGEAFDAFEKDGRPHSSLRLLIKVLCHYKLPNMELVVNHADKPVVPKTSGRLLPVFSWCKTVAHWDIMMPYNSFLHLAPDAAEAARTEAKLLTDGAWRGKADTAFWRGSTTGGIWNASNWRSMARYKLVKACHQRPDLCDAQITRFTQFTDAQARSEAMAELGTHPRTAPEEAYKHKYIIVVDGNTAASSRIKLTLLKSSLVLWQQTAYQEFWYAGLRPYVHYLPLSEGLEDLHARIEWAQRNQAAAKEMVRSAQRYAQEHFNTEVGSAYLYVLLKEYATLMRYKPRLDAAYRRGRVRMTGHQFADFVRFTGLQHCPHWQQRYRG